MKIFLGRKIPAAFAIALWLAVVPASAQPLSRVDANRIPGVVSTITHGMSAWLSAGRLSVLANRLALVWPAARAPQNPGTGQSLNSSADKKSVAPLALEPARLKMPLSFSGSV